MFHRLKNEKVLNLLAFTMAFCSFSYEILIASRVSRIAGEGMFYYPACLGIFIFFMGLGSSRIYFKSQNKSSFSIEPLIKIEILLSLLGSISIASIDLSLKEALYHINLEAYLVGFVLSALIGYFSGQELPFLFHLCEELHLNQKQVRTIIFYDYLASFVASVICALVFFAHFGFFKTSILIAFLNLFVVFLLFKTSSQNNISYKKKYILFAFSLLSIFTLLTIRLETIENSILKRTYLGERNTRLLGKEYTPYQQVLLYIMRKDQGPITKTSEQMLEQPEDYYLFAILNGTLQFFEPLEINADPDHTFLFDPYIQLLPSVENVLILGGGDGLPARQAVTYPSLKKITNIDIDEEWVNFSQTHPFMKKKNNNAFADKRVQLYFDDAFKWIIRTPSRYDLIIVDFPSEPFTLAKLRTTSLQFFRDLKRILSSQGAVIIHSNTLSLELKLSLIAQTAEKAGLFPLYGFKKEKTTWSEVEQIVLFNNEIIRDKFFKEYPSHYVKSPMNTSKIQRFGNLQYRYLKPNHEWISFYDPLVSRLNFKDKLELLSE